MGLKTISALNRILMEDFIDKSVLHDKNEVENKIKAISLIIKELKISVEKKINVNLNDIKNRACKKYKVANPPKLTDIIAAVPNDLKKDLIPKLRVKPCRTASGIAIIAVMAKPHRCPHIYYTGHICVYCPGGPDSDFEYSSQSYTGYEPTSMRAIRARYDPYKQVRSRVDQLEALGHNVQKIEFILMGGTFMSLDKEYRDKFITGLHDALSGYHSKSIDEAIFFSERSMYYRCIGLTIETRPDYCQVKHLNEMLSYGCTRLEIGIQSIYEDVALDTNRGHTVAAACESIKMAKNYGFKITAHLMPDLPNVGLDRDLYQFEEFFKNPDFRADGLKIYPTLVIRGTGLYELWKTKRYRNYTSSVLIDLIAQVMSLIPPWVRVYRIQRDIPMPLVSSSGVSHGHLRDMVMERMRNLGLPCRDVRSREVGIKEIHDKVKPDQIELIRRDYYANGGWETFLSYEDPKQDILIGLLRLRKCPENPHDHVKNWSIVRELHVYGTAVGVSERDESKFQHQGFGLLLMEEAEKIARFEHSSAQLGVISGIGTRNYYRKLGFSLSGPYMIKNLTCNS